MVTTDLSRREVLRTAGATGLGALTFGTGTAAGDGRDEYNVGTASPAAEQAARNAAGRVKRVLVWGDNKKTVTGTFSEEAIDNLDQRADVRYTEVDGKMHALAQELPWGIDRIDAEIAHDKGETGSGADIAIIDTGIDSDHPDLVDNLGTGHYEVACGDCSCFPPGFSCGNDNDCHENWDDDHDHGTHVAGIADALDNSDDVVGVSTQATLHAVKVLDCGGGGSFSDVAAGIKWVADQGYHVANMSLGGDKSNTVEDAVEDAYGRGVLLVASAGNEGPCSDCVSYPAAEPEVIAVSATSRDDSLADFSSTGSEVELAAPGENILSTVPPESSSDGTETFSGTSMASPHVAGTAGQIWDNTSDSNDDGLKNDDVRQKLRDTAEDIGLGDNEQGYGLVDAASGLDLDSSDNLLTVETRDASNVGSDSATLNGEVTEFAGVGSTDVWFKYREQGADTWTETVTQTLSSTGTFSEDITGLDSDVTYEFRAVADGDGDGTIDDDGAILTFTTDSSGDGSGDNAPTASVDGVNEAETPTPHAEFDIDWSASDEDGDLDSVTVSLHDDTDGKNEGSETIDVSGDSASGTTRLKAKHDDGSGNDYTATVEATDSNGNTATESESFSENGS